MIIKLITKKTTELVECSDFKPTVYTEGEMVGWVHLEFNYMNCELGKFKQINKEMPLWIYVMENGKTVDSIEFLETLNTDKVEIAKEFNK